MADRGGWTQRGSGHDDYGLEPDAEMTADARRAVRRKVGLAALLFVAGGGLLAGGLGALLAGPPGAGGTATAMIVLGSLTFAPGAYFTRVAYLAHSGVEGYSMQDIPDV
jgi:hypothetical protein